MRTSIFLLATACLVAAWPSTLKADSTHYQTLQLGERSRGMAGAFTAVAGDGSALYYNPAGLASIEARTLQGALSLGQLRKRVSKDAITFEDAEGVKTQDFTLKSNPTLPGFAATSFALGKRNSKGERPLGMSIGAFQTYNVEYVTDVQIPDPQGRTNTIQLDQTDRLTYIGAGIGWKAFRNFQIGLSVFAVRRTIRHNEQLTLALDGNPAPGQESPPFFEDSFLLSRGTRFNMDNWSMVFRIGMLQKIKDRWRIGLMIQPPGFRIAGNSSLRFQQNDLNATEAPANSTSFFGEQSGFKSRSPIPWEVRLGIAYELVDRFIVDVDLQLVGRVKEGSIAPSIPNIPERSPTTGVFLATSTERDFTWNVSVGADIDLTSYLFMRLGFLTDRTSAPSGDPSRTDLVQISGIDRYGFTFSIGAHRKGRGLSAGVAGLWGSGTANGIDVTALEPGGNAEGFFYPVSIKERILIISIGGDIGKAKRSILEIKKEVENDEEFDERLKEERQDFNEDQVEERDERLERQMRERARQGLDPTPPITTPPEATDAPSEPPVELPGKDPEPINAE